MPSIFGSSYAPPGVYTYTQSDNPATALLAGVRLPILIGTGTESLTQTDLEVVRGSSSVVDQRIVQEDATGRAVVSVSQTGQVTLGAFDGVINRIQVRRYPIVNGDGTGTTATRPSNVIVQVNGTPIVVTAMDGAKGILSLSVPPAAGDEVRVTYYFKRTDTRVTDDLSDQVTTDVATVYGMIGQSYTISAGDNDTLSILVDDATTVTVTISDSGNSSWSAAQIAAFINAAAFGTSLVASAATNNFGATVVLLTADRNIAVNAGSANSTLGFTAGTKTDRNKVFYTFNGPIVTGNNGGVTTTDPTDVTVKVDGVAVIPSSVDGLSRTVTLPFAPESGATVTVTYYFNAWQDTFDYLANRNISDITLCGVSPGRSDFIDEVDFVLQDDTIVWGTAALVRAGEHTQGTILFDDTQITPTLVDVRAFMQPCAAVVDTSVSPPVESRTRFTLPLVPTTGNGRNSPLGSSLFQTVSNDRIDLPTNRPDLVVAYWGFGLQDAIDRGPVTVLQVESSNSSITLKDPVPVGASVFATLYYNTVGDVSYTVTVETPGASGVGTYSITNGDGDELLTPLFGSKSSGLATIALQFPSGSERKPDVRFEVPFDTAAYTGPVEEDITVTFQSLDGTLGEFTVAGAGPYEIVHDASDHIRLLVDGSALAGGAAGIDLGANVSAGLGFAAAMVGDEVEYLADSGSITYAIDATNNGIDLTIDSVLVSATAVSGASQTLAAYVTAINTAATATAPEYRSAGRFLSPIEILNYDEITFHYTGDITGATGNQIIVLSHTTYNSVALLAAEIDNAMATAIAGLGIPGLAVNVTANGDGNLVFALTKANADLHGYLEFITGAAPSRDFCVLAGIDTAAATNGVQTKVVDGPVARRFTITGDNTSALLHDRIVLRSRIVPGSGTILPYQLLDYAGIVMGAGSGNTQAGLVANTTAPAGLRATVLEASMLGEVGFANGQIPAGTFIDVRDGQPSVTFYADGGTTPQNNVFKFSVDGTPVTVTFTDASGTAIPTAGSADVPLGPATSTDTVIEQIRAALVVAGFSGGEAASIARQEGAGIRLTSLAQDSAGIIVIGSGSANDVLGFSAGQIAERTLPSVGQVASRLMAHTAGSVNLSIVDWPTPLATYFGAEALAKVVTDETGAEYLFLQSQGTSGLGVSSSIAFAAATTEDVLLPGVGLGVSAGDGGTGEAGVSGFWVSSSDPVAGSGSANTSVLNPANDGTGQDGVVGATYRDLVTGLTFSLLERSGGTSYPDGESFTFTVRRVMTTDSNLPVNTIPGVELLVTNTLGVGDGDTAVVQTFKRSGSEPAIGDLYYVTYNYLKDDFQTRTFTKLATIEANYGALSPENPVTLAAYLAILNGAVLVGIKQVQKDTDTNADEVYDTASVEAFRAAVDDLEGALPGGILPDILVPLRGDSSDLFSYMTRHADIQSDLRHRAERTVIAGVAAGTQPRTVGDIAQSIARTRFRIVYPDILTVPLPRADGPDESALVDGTYLAAMLAGSVVSPNTDVATPWTNRRLLGSSGLARILDAVEQNQVSVRGVTVIEDRPPALRVRHGLTSDMSSPLLKLPTIQQIVDETQRQTRATLERFIGQKFLPGVLSQIEGQLSTTLKQLVAQQILSAYTGVKATLDPTDPTAASVEATIAPVFPLLYITVRFSLRASL